MGLDITLYKPVKDETSDNIYVLKDVPELEAKFAHLSFIKENEYYDLELGLENLGYKMEDLEWRGTEYGETTIYKFYDENHSLYDADKWLQDIWDKTYFKTLEELQNSEQYKNFKENFFQKMLDCGWEEKYDFYASGSDENYFNLVPAHNFSSKTIEVKLINPPIIKKQEQVIAVEEVGYQRKGANKQFGVDDMYNAPCVTDLETLKEHHKKYFTFEEVPETEENKYRAKTEDFKRNIVDKFVEGETFVIYH